jgi:hypothetical protein
VAIEKIISKIRYGLVDWLPLVYTITRKQFHTRITSCGVRILVLLRSFSDENSIRLMNFALQMLLVAHFSENITDLTVYIFAYFITRLLSYAIFHRTAKS